MKEVVLFYPKPWPGEGSFGRIPYSLLHLYSYLQDDGYKISIVDERVVSDMSLYIRGLTGDFICFGISSFTGIQISNGLKISRLLKENFPDVPVVWGGWHPSSMPEQTLSHPLVDIVVKGQGEETFRDLLRALNGEKTLFEVKGISFKDRNGIRHNPVRELLPLLENLKISYDVIDVNDYIFKQPWGNRSVGVITSLGCPFSCNFCAVTTVYNRRTFFKCIDNVMEEIDYLVANYNIDSITFDDDNFFVSPQRTKEFCEKLIQRPYRILWDAGAHVGLLLRYYDDELLTLIKESGCKQLYIGAESGSDEVLDIVDKQTTVAETYKYVRIMKEKGIQSFLSTMVCFPGTHSEDIYQTMDMILKCRDIDPSLGYRLFYYTPYPSTTLYKTALAMGMKEPESLDEWSHHTLRKFKAPWIKSSYRSLIRYFIFYYFPYSAMDEHKQFRQSITRQYSLSSFLSVLYQAIFVNRFLIRLAKWRVKNRYFKFPLDAFFVIQGERLKSLYTQRILKVSDLFSDYED